MDFQHSSEIWRDFPELVPGVVFATGITRDVAAGDRVAKFTAVASSRLEREPESELPEIRAWRRAFTKMGLKPTLIFADQARQVHARRWTNRQSGLSAVQDATATVLIVTEAMHDTASSDVPELIATIAAELNALWSITPAVTVLSESAPRFTFPA